MKFHPRTAETLLPKPGQTRTDYFDDDLPRFGLRVSASTKGEQTVYHRAWCLFYRYKGQQKRLGLGTVETLKLSEARDKARKLLKLLPEQDPAQQRDDDRAQHGNTWPALGAHFIEKLKAGVAKGTIAKNTLACYPGRINKYILPFFKRKSVTLVVDTTTEHVAALWRSLDATPIQANRVQSLTLTLLEEARQLGWYKKHNVVSSDLQRHDEEALKGESRRAYTPAEIRAFYTALPSLPVPDVVKHYLFALFENGQRRDEVATMKWTDLDLDEAWWALPKAATKNKRGIHRVPLSPDLVQLLRARKQLTEAWARGEGVSKHVRRKQLTVPGYADVTYVFWSRTPATSIVESLARFATKINTHFAGSFKLEYHNTRRTVATQGVAAKIAVHDLGLVLNHSTGRKSITGNRQTDKYVEEYAYDEPKDAAVQQWATHLKKFKPAGLRLVKSA